MAQVELNDPKEKQNLEDIKSKFAIMDTGVSYAILPVDDFLLIKKYLKSNYSVTCKEPEKSSLTSTHTCTCPDHDILPDIQISLQQSESSNSEHKTFTLPRESYMEKVGQGCNTLRLTPSTEKFGAKEDSNYWVLGDIFLQNYYSIYDLPKNRLGLIENKDFTARK